MRDHGDKVAGPGVVIPSGSAAACPSARVGRFCIRPTSFAGFLRACSVQLGQVQLQLQLFASLSSRFLGYMIHSCHVKLLCADYTCTGQVRPRFMTKISYIHGAALGLAVAVVRTYLAGASRQPRQD